MKVAAVQMTSNLSVDDNLARARDLVADAVAEGAKLVVLPENVCLMTDTHERRLAAAARGQEVAKRLAETARELNVCLVGGTVPLPAVGDLVTNSCLVFAANGQQLGRYDKMHLFDVDLGDGQVYRESDYTAAGDEPLIVEMLDMRVGITVCYDLRFPELYRRLALNGAEVFTVPSAFTVSTGRAHWEVLLRARAIENLAAVIAPAQVGHHAGGRVTYGHSTIISPWGEILASRREGNGVVVGEIDLDELRGRRRDFPALCHRRWIDTGPVQMNFCSKK